MRKLVALVTLSTLAALGAVATVAGTASALEPNSGIEQATVERQDLQFVSRGPTSSTTNLETLDVLVESAPREAADTLGALAEHGSSVSAHEMLEMAMLMNHFSQVSDMASSFISPSNAAISNMSRNIKS